MSTEILMPALSPTMEEGKLAKWHVKEGDGFGLSSTKNRLQLLFGEKANFEIKQVGSDMVEARILIPVEIK